MSVCPHAQMARRCMGYDLAVFLVRMGGCTVDCVLCGAACDHVLSSAFYVF